MEHLKTFEKYEHLKNGEYIVTYVKYLNKYFIDKISFINDDTSLVLTNYYSWNKNKSTIEKLDYHNETMSIKYLDNVVYSSNIIEDCYEYLKLLINTQKYNI